ncbi:hypothetical protein B484DRAFT_458907 [Ochromonadaceae sp. CCMP2298]|nr:hypothetical protein B484DRAFT_458907 [Ochromonadaceae sp. CCMP2298]
MRARLGESAIKSKAARKKLGEEKQELQRQVDAVTLRCDDLLQQESTHAAGAEVAAQQAAEVWSLQEELEALRAQHTASTSHTAALVLSSDMSSLQQAARQLTADAAAQQTAAEIAALQQQIQQQLSASREQQTASSAAALALSSEISSLQQQQAADAAHAAEAETALAGAGADMGAIRVLLGESESNAIMGLKMLGEEKQELQRQIDAITAHCDDLKRQESTRAAEAEGAAQQAAEVWSLQEQLKTLRAQHTAGTSDALALRSEVAGLREQEVELQGLRDGASEMTDLREQLEQLESTREAVGREMGLARGAVKAAQRRAADAEAALAGAEARAAEAEADAGDVGAMRALLGESESKLTAARKMLGEEKEELQRQIDAITAHCDPKEPANAKDAQLQGQLQGLLEEILPLRVRIASLEVELGESREEGERALREAQVLASAAQERQEEVEVLRKTCADLVDRDGDGDREGKRAGTRSAPATPVQESREDDREWGTEFGSEARKGHGREKRDLRDEMEESEARERKRSKELSDEQLREYFYFLL